MVGGEWDGSSWRVGARAKEEGSEGSERRARVVDVVGV